MNKILKGVLIVAAAASLVLSMTSCGGGSPTTTAKAFISAVEEGDAKAMEKVATKDTVALIGMFGEKIAESMKEYGKITNTAEKIDGDKAAVSLTFENGETEEVTLIKQDGKWLVNISK